MVQYQPDWINGSARGAHQRESEARYRVIRAQAARYDRPFSVFDLGANAGYFSIRLAEDFPHATVVAADDKPQLRKNAEANGLANLIVLPKRLSGLSLLRLASCERFDLVLALNVLHHIQDWPEAMSALKAMAHRLIVETPPEGDVGAAHPDRHGPIMAGLAGAEFIAEFPAHTTAGLMRPVLALKGADETSLSAQTIDARERNAPAMSKHVIRRSYSDARIVFDRGEDRDFVPGMNLWNFALLSGAWPRNPAGMVEAEVARIEAQGQWPDDLRPWNFVLSAGRAVAIDLGNKRRKEPEPGGLKKTLDMLRKPEWGATGL